MPNLKVRGAGLSDVSVKNTSGDSFDLDAVVSAEGDPQTDVVEVKGDDELKNTFVFNIRESITLQANGVSFDVLQEITGNSWSSDATTVDVALGTDSEKNTPFVEITASSVAKDDAGTACVLKKVWHKVQITGVKASSAGEQEYNVEISGTAYQTEDDIEGVALTSKRVATLTADYS